MAETGISVRCDVCKQPFAAKRPHAKHCSARCARAAYAQRHLPSLKAAVAYLEREIARLENQLTGTRRRGKL